MFSWKWPRVQYLLSLRTLLVPSWMEALSELRNITTVIIQMAKYPEKKPLTTKDKKQTVLSTGEMASQADSCAIENCSHCKIQQNLPSWSNCLKIVRKSQEVSFVFPWKWVTNGWTPLSLAIFSKLSLKWNVNIRR